MDVGDRPTAHCEVVEAHAEGRFRLAVGVSDAGKPAVDGEAVVLVDESVAE